MALARFWDCAVSTVFIGLDHRFLGEGDPLVFETLIFGGEHDGEMWRCSTWAQAEQQHLEAITLAQRRSWRGRARSLCKLLVARYRRGFRTVRGVSAH